jgi:hypothetical protein
MALAFLASNRDANREANLAPPDWSFERNPEVTAVLNDIQHVKRQFVMAIQSGLVPAMARSLRLLKFAGSRRCGCVCHLEFTGLELNSRPLQKV